MICRTNVYCNVHVLPSVIISIRALDYFAPRHESSLGVADVVDPRLRDLYRVILQIINNVDVANAKVLWSTENCLSEVSLEEQAFLRVESKVRNELTIALLSSAIGQSRIKTDV